MSFPPSLPHYHHDHHCSIVGYQRAAREPDRALDINTDSCLHDRGHNNIPEILRHCSDIKLVNLIHKN